MRYAGFGLFVVGLTVASWYASYVPEGVGAARIGNWFDAVGLRFVAGFATMLVGVALARLAGRTDGPEEHAAEANAPTAAGAMEKVRGIRDRIDGFVARELSPKDVAADAQALAADLDHLLNEDVPVFLDARPRVIDRYGLATFAELIGHFAVMERAIARAWSAITDEAFQEVPPALDKAQAAIHRACEVADGAEAAREKP